MMTTCELNKERLQTIASWRAKYSAGHNVVLPAEEAEAMARMLLAGNSPAVPDGWMLVPVEPTPEMRDAYHNAREEYEDMDGLYSPDHQWKAMLAAAPNQENS